MTANSVGAQCVRRLIAARGLAAALVASLGTHGAAPDVFAQTLTPITVNAADPTRVITRVAVNGWPVEASGRGTSSVRFAVPPDGAGETWCVNDVAITTASGDHASRAVNVCQAGETITMAIEGAAPIDGALPVPERLRWTLVELPSATGTGAQGTGSAGTSAAVPVLAFEMPQTDGRLIEISCLNGFAGARVSAAQLEYTSQPDTTGRLTVQTARRQGEPARRVRAGSSRLSYDAVASAPASDESPPQLSINLALSDPLFEILRTAGTVLLQTDRSHVIAIEMAEGRSVVETFVTRCAATAPLDPGWGAADGSVTSDAEGAVQPTSDADYSGGTAGLAAAPYGADEPRTSTDPGVSAPVAGGGGTAGLGTTRVPSTQNGSGAMSSPYPSDAQSDPAGGAYGAYMAAGDRAAPRAQPSNRGATAPDRPARATASPVAGGDSASAPAAPGLPGWLDPPALPKDDARESPGAVASAPSTTAPPQPAVIDPFPRQGGREGDYERRRRYFRDYMTTCATDGVCEAITFSATETASGGTFMSNLAFTRAPGRTAGWEIAYAGPFEQPAAGSMALAEIDGERWRLAHGRDYARVGNSSVFLPPSDAALMRAMRAGLTLRITHTVSSGARKTVDYSLRGLTAAMTWIAQQQQRSPGDLALRQPRTR